MWPFSLFRRKKKPELGLQPKPLVVNPSGNARTARNLERLARLRQAVAAGDNRPELRDELKRREKETPDA